MAHKFSFRWIGITALAAMVLLALPAKAQIVCGLHNDLVAGLVDTFQEKQLGYGVIGQDAVIEIYVSARGTWTILITDVNGGSCILAAGDGWENTFAVSTTARGD